LNDNGTVDIIGQTSANGVYLIPWSHTQSNGNLGEYSSSNFRIDGVQFLTTQFNQMFKNNESGIDMGFFKATIPTTNNLDDKIKTCLNNFNNPKPE
jgi:predicted NAD-dependent protein-ADP-ribosyltransferase YbiA (DUF1768 family)